MRTALTLLAAALVLTACGGSDEPEPEAEPRPSPAATSAEATASPEPAPEPDDGVEVDIVIADGAVTPQGERVEVAVGEPVVLNVTSDAADELHVHSDPEHTFGFAAGDVESFTFTVDTPGQAAVELHELGATVVQLVVRP